MTVDQQVIASMIAWLDSRDSWAEVHAAGVVTDAEVIAAWLASQAANREDSRS